MPCFYGMQRIPNINLANIDKIRIRIANAYSIQFENVSDYNAFKNELGRSDLLTQGMGSRSSTFSIVKNHRRLGPRWLYGGEIQFKTNGSNTHYRTVVNLELNPSRFINHFVHSTGILQNTEQAYGRLRSYLTESRPYESLESCLDLPLTALALDGNDNLIPSQAYRHMRPATRIFREYLNKVLEHIREEISAALVTRVSPNRYTLEEPMEGCILTYAEIYHEYSVSNSIAFINGLRDHIMPLFQNAEATEYMPPVTNTTENEAASFSWSTEGNAPSLRLNRGSSDINLVVYAKTPQRVRFEVRYSSNVRAILGSRRIRASDLPAGVAGIVQLLQIAISHTNTYLTNVIENLPDLDFSERCNFQEFVEFLSALAAACNSNGIPLQLHHIMSLLASNGGIEVRLNSPEHNACKALEQRNILFAPSAVRNRPHYKQYTLRPRYTTAIRAMVNGFDGTQDLPR